jgi:endonuclease/exonuclease/phosphatase family metal-dependent hydrolase
LVTVLVVCVTTALVVTVEMRNNSAATTTDASLDLTSQVPLIPPSKQRERGASADRHAALVSRSADADAARGTTKRSQQPPPQKVVGGSTIVHKTKAQIDAALARAAELQAAKQTMTFQIGTFNVLGSQHSTPSGDHRSYPSARIRSPRAVARIRSFGVDILGTQELQPDQLNALQAMTGYAAYPGYAFGANETDNSILYDDSRFEFVSGSFFTIHFMHANRPQTILRLRDKETGREFYVLNMHASAGHGGSYAATRRAGHYTAAATVNHLKAEGIPIFLTGDMNDRAEFFCRVAPITGMVAAIGGSTAGGCHPAGALAVDWVMGWGNVSFSNYIEDRSTMRTTSDHYFVSATATVGPMS